MSSLLLNGCPVALPRRSVGSKASAGRPVSTRTATRAVPSTPTRLATPPNAGPVDNYNSMDAPVDGWDKLSLEEIEGWESEGPPTPLLDIVNFPMHMKNFNTSQLIQLCRELRSDIVHKTGGHLSSSLGVTELTVALHHVFNTPEDKIIWDVGHQAYGHKILTGRRDRMDTIRTTNGLSGFTKREESVYDPFGAGHSSTSISAGLGMAVGRDFKGKKNSVIAVIGDGAVTGGMAYEAMNHAGFLDSNMIVILNDNQQVSLPTQYNNKNQHPVGALSSALGRLQANKPLRELREVAKGVTKQLPDAVQKATAKIDEYARGMISGTGSTLFEELGLYYIEVRTAETAGPVLIHLITEKGRGYIPAETSQDKMHGVGKFDPKTGKQQAGKASPTMSYTNYFADSLTAEAARDNRVVAVHAAMGGGTGLTRYGKEGRFPDRVFDVGIAEQHAVTFAAGLACEGLIPFATIYSTFLQRGYDQIMHDVALQRLPVRFAMDRAGMVGADGATHCGMFDITYMASLPHMICMAPSNEAELINMIATSVAIDAGPSCFRQNSSTYSLPLWLLMTDPAASGNGIGVDLAANGITKDLKGRPLEIGKGIVRREGKDVCLLAYGSSVNEAIAAAEMLALDGISATVVDARFCKPLDTELVRRCAKEHPVMISIEEGAIGGFAAHVLTFLTLNASKSSLRTSSLSSLSMFRPMTMPDRWIEGGDYKNQLAEAGLTAGHIAATAITTLGLRTARSPLSALI
eukprot:gene10645-12324_t